MNITIVRGDITKQDGIDAVVNAAKPSLLGGGGVDGCIHRAAGPQLVEACRALPLVRDDEVGESTRHITAGDVRCQVGRAFLTGAFGLPVRYIIHTVGPKYDPAKREEMGNLLASAYQNSLLVAVAAGCRTVAFPAISTGVYSYPLVEAAEVAFATVWRHIGDLDEVRFVLFEEAVYEVFREVGNPFREPDKVQSRASGA